MQTGPAAGSLAYRQACARLSSAISTHISASPNLSPSLQFPPSTKSFQEAQSQLNQAAAGLNQSANELVQASRGTPQDLAKSSGKFGHDFNEFLQAGVEMASQSPVRGNACWGILNEGRDLGYLTRWLTKDRVARQWWLEWLWPMQPGRWGLELCKTTATGRRWPKLVQQEFMFPCCWLTSSMKGTSSA